MKKEAENSTVKMELEDLKNALGQSQRQFQSLVKNIPGIVYLCYYDEHWTMHYMVKEIENISGYPASDFINNNVRSYASIIHPDDVDLVEQAVKEGVSKNKAYEMEYRIIRKDGEIVWVYEKGQQIPSQDSKILLNGIIFDINKHKQTVIALDIASKEWRTTFNAIPSAVFLLNRESCIVKCNHSAITLLGKNKKELIGQRYCKVIDGQDEPSKDGPYIHMLKTGHKQSVVRLLGEKTVEFTFAPILDPEGEIYGSVLLIVDISELKKKETLLKNQKEQLKSIFHTLPIGIGVISKRIFIQVNEQICKLSGYTEEELVGKDSRMLYINDEEYKRFADSYEHLKGNETVTLQSYLKCKDGKEIKVSVNISPLNTDINRFIFTIMPID